MWAIGRTVEARGPGVVSLDDAAAQTVALGGKASNLARARAAGLPVIEGFVIPAPLAARLARSPRGEPVDDVELVRAAWGSLSRRGSDPVVVRSSSVAEDTATSSQAGLFDSVVDVRGWDDFLDAVRTVAVSGRHLPAAVAGAQLAVLVQRHVDPVCGGVLFGVDPVSGRADRLVVAVVPGGPQALVGGSDSGTRLVLDRHGRVAEGRPRHAPLRTRERIALARLARSLHRLFGGPQDVEWAIDRDGRLLLLQSRPITSAVAPGEGPVLGPGPVAETFPEPLRPLEQELWLSPLRDALRVVLEITGSAAPRALDRSPIALAVGGRAAVDLDLLEGGRARRRGLALLDPRPPARRLRVAWQVGRLRSGLPAMTDDLVDWIDRELRAVPALGELDDEALVRLLHRGRSTLRAAHGYELLAGTLTADGGRSGAAAALAALTAGRRAGWSDAEIVAADPAVLALAPPAIGATPELPPAASLVTTTVPGGAAMGAREALRLRIRWLHELTARAAATLGARLAARGQLADAASVADLALPALARAVRSGEITMPPPPVAPGPPLPARFRLAVDGTPVAVAHAGAVDGAGTAAGGGRAVGLVTHDPDDAAGRVLVVATLDPRLAPVLPGLAGLVAQTGSPLSHLAILAREHGVPVVVGVDDAPRRLPAGVEALVDGRTGEARAITSARGAVT